ncbi:MAG: hypothetical protein JHC84_21685 [Solirubrobacteraceae bacterium]|nr:hypothetical protein [Solirubrobacteraceae bacterium]
MPRLVLLVIALFFLLLGRLWQYGAGFCDSGGCDGWAHAEWLTTLVVVVPALAAAGIVVEAIVTAKSRGASRRDDS